MDGFPQAQIPAFRRSHREMFRGQRATCFWISESECTTREPQKGGSWVQSLSPCRPRRTELIRCCTQREPLLALAGLTVCMSQPLFGRVFDSTQPLSLAHMLNAFRCFFLHVEAPCAGYLDRRPMHPQRGESHPHGMQPVGTRMSLLAYSLAWLLARLLASCPLAHPLTSHHA